MNTALKDSQRSSLILDVVRGQKTDRVPCWFMRQAGRYLPEYLELRSKHTMLESIQSAELATEITLQPLRRYDLDAAIIFADILNPLIGMGIDLDFIKGSGPKIFNPIKDRSDILRLKVPDPQASVPATLAALKFLSKHELLKSRALIGFAGAPFTLSSYILEGESSDKLHVAKVWMYQNKSAWHELQEKLTEYISNYLIAQAEAGADILQLFDSWLGYLSPSDYTEFVEPYLMKIFNKIRSATTVPIIFFATGCSSLFSQFKDLPIDVLGVDWRMSLSDAAKITDNKFVLQGNLDPLTLFAPSEKIEAEVKKIMVQSKNLKGHIFNLGHGIIPKTPLTAPELVLRAIRDYK